MYKNLVVTIILVIATSSLMAVNPTCAQSLTSAPIPLKPEFSIAVTNSSYYVPVTYSIDPSTGQEIANTSYYSDYVDSLNVTITIKNQPLALSVKSDEYNGFKYFIEVKPHNSADWLSFTGYIDGLGHTQVGLGFVPSNSTSTTLAFQFSNPYFPVNDSKEFPANSNGLTYATNPFFPITVAKNEPADFRFRAGIGELYYISMGQLLFKGNYSDWSQLMISMTNGETSTTPTVSPSPTPSPTISPAPSPTPLPQESSLIIAVTAVVIAVIVVSVGLFVYFKKRKHQ
jgi:hypothetical protein